MAIPAAPLPVMAHLTDRDLTIIDWLDRHGVLTTDQITAAFFTAASTATHRLLKLRSLDLIDRFHRPNPAGGFGPWHWVIGTLGAQLAAAARGQPEPTAKALRTRHARLARDPQLAHHLAASQFFIDLHRHTRHHPGAQLLRWWSTHDTETAYHNRIHPDGHALWREHTRHGPVTIGLFLEYDRGTEFSGGPGSVRSPDLRVVAAQRLMLERYRLQQVWCKHIGAVSPVRVLCVGCPTRTVHERRWCMVAAGAGRHDTDEAVGSPVLQGHAAPSRSVFTRPARPVVSRACCPCWCQREGWFGCPSRDGQPNRPAEGRSVAARCRSGGMRALTRKTFRGLLPVGDGNYARQR